MSAGTHRTSQVVLVVVLSVLFLAVVGWFVNEDVPLRVLICAMPIVAAGYTLLGGMLWFVLTHDEPPQ